METDILKRKIIFTIILSWHRKSSDLYKRQSGFLQQTLGIADLCVHLLYKHANTTQHNNSLMVIILRQNLQETRQSHVAGRTEVHLPSCRLDCLLMRLDRDPTTEFLFLNLQKVLKQCDKNIMTHTNSHSGTVYSQHLTSDMCATPPWWLPWQPGCLFVRRSWLPASPGCCCNPTRGTCCPSTYTQTRRLPKIPNIAASIAGTVAV